MPPLHENDSSSSPTLASVPAASKRIAAATQLDATAPIPVTPPVRADVAAVVPLHREVVLVAPLSHADRGTPRVSARRDAGNAASSPFGRGAAVAARVAIRTAIYFAYDGVGAARKEGARVAKAILELLLDEAAPPPARREMSIARKVVECVAPPAASSLAWCALRHLRRRPRMRGARALPAMTFALAHRAARHALIHRLFFQFGSREYTLASALGLICCFFHEALLLDLLRPARWLRHVAPAQGIGALARSALYAAAFALPLAAALPALARLPRRRAAAKKLAFALALALIRVLRALAHRVSPLAQA